MDKSASPKADKTTQTLPEAPFATFIQLDGKSPFHRHFVLRELLRSFGYSRRLGFLTESQSYRLSRLY